MNNVNKTLYIPLYGKSYVSKKGLFLADKKAEEIWAAEGFALKGKSKSKWLAYYMGIRSAVFDDWLRHRLEEAANAVVIHIGCGMDGRVLRVGTNHHRWYDVDFTEVITERKRYYTETDGYQMLAGDVRGGDWLNHIPQAKHAVVVMEGVTMYLTNEDLKGLMARLDSRFERIECLMDCYTKTAAKLSKFRNPVKDVGVAKVYGVNDPKALQHGEFLYVQEHDLTPQRYIDELKGMEKRIFSKLYAGRFSKKLYKLFEYKKG